MVLTHFSHATQHPKENPFTVSFDPLATIVSQLDAIDELREKVSALEALSSHHNRSRGKIHHYANDSDKDFEGSRCGFRFSYTKIEFPKFSGGGL